MPFINVHRDEWGKVVITWLMIALLAMGYAIGWSAIHAMLVKRMGVQYLPYTYIGISLLGMIGASLYLMFTDAVRRDRLLIISSTATALVLLGSRLLVDNDYEGQTEFTLKLVMFFVLVIAAQGLGNSTLATQVWTIINDVFRPNQSRRLYPILGTAGTVGGILGGLSIQALVELIGTANLVLIWAGATFAIVPLMMIFQKKYGGELRGIKLPTSAASEEGQKKESRFKNMIAGFHYALTSPILQVVSVVAVMFWVVGSLSDYQYTTIMANTFKGEKALSMYYGYYTIAFNFTALMLQFFLSSKIITYIGIGRSLIVLPVVIILGFVGIRLDFAFIPGLLMRYAWDVIGMSIQGNGYQLVLNSTPGPLRGRVRGFMDGLVNPLGGMLGGVVIVAIQFLFNIKTGDQWGYHLLTYIGLGLSAIWLIVVLPAQRKYLKAVITNLGSSDRQTYLDAIELLEERGSPQAYGKLISILNSPDKTVQLSAIRVLPGIGKPEALRALSAILDRPDEDVRAAAIQAITRFSQVKHNAFLKVYFNSRIGRIFAEDPSPAVRAEAARYLIKAQDPREMPRFIHELLSHPEAEIRIKVIETISSVALDYADFVLEGLLKDKDPNVRSAAIMSLWRIEERKAAVSVALLSLLESASPEDRAAGLTATIRLKVKEYLPQVSGMLSDSNTNVSCLASLAILVIGEADSKEWQQATGALLEAFSNPAVYDNLPHKLMPLLPCLKEEGLDALILGIAALPPEKRKLAAGAMEQLHDIMKKSSEAAEG